MAVDTQDKRVAAFYFLRPWRGYNFPSGSVGEADRAILLSSYLPFEVPESTTPPSRTYTVGQEVRTCTVGPEGRTIYIKNEGRSFIVG